VSEMTRLSRWAQFAPVPLLLLLSLSAGQATAPAAQAKSVKLRTLAVTSELIQTFAQDGNAVAWISWDRYRVHVRNLSTGTDSVLGNAGGYLARLRPPSLALSGTRVIWTRSWFGTRLYIDVMTASPSDRLASGRPRVVGLAELAQGDEQGQDAYFGGAAGDGATLVYGWAHLRPVSDEPGIYNRVIDGGGVVRVMGKPADPPPASAIPNISAPAPRYSNGGREEQTKQLAASQGRVAVLPPAAVTPGQYWYAFPRAAENGPIAVYGLNGAPISRVSPVGIAREIALSWPQLAVLVQRHDGTRAVELYDAAKGTLRSATVVPSAAADLAIGTGQVVYRVGRAIYGIRVGGPALLWRAKAPPIGLSIEGHRMAWAVNLNGRGRIVALKLR
jgi:hypothetical protein